MGLESEVKIKFNADTAPAEKSLKLLGTAIKGIITYEVIKKVGEFTAELIKAGDYDLRMEKVFTATAQCIGVNADFMLSKMKTASRGMIEAANLQAMANKALLNSYSPNEIIAWTELATNYALSTGQNVSQMLDTVFSSLAMGNQKAIKQMGIDTKVVNGLIVADLKVLKENAVELGKAIGKDEDSPVIQMQKLTVEFKELKGELGKGLLPVATSILKYINESIDAWKTLYAITLGGVDIEDERLKRTIKTAVAEKNTLMLFDLRQEKLNNINKLEKEISERRDLDRTQIGVAKEKIIELEKEAEALKIAMSSITGAPIAGGEKKIGAGDDPAAVKAAKERAKKMADAYNNTMGEAADAYAEDSKAQWQSDIEWANYDLDIRLKNAKKIEDLQKEISSTSADIKQTELEQFILTEEEKRQAIQSTIDLASTLTNGLMQLGDIQSDKEIKNIDRKHMSQKQYDKKVAAIEAERAERNRRYARMQQAIILAQTISVVSKGAAEALANNPPFYKWIDMAAVIASGAIQIATIQAQHFQTEYLSRTRTRDSIPAMIGRGEAVIPSPQTAMHRAEIEGIINNTANTVAGRSGKSSTYVFNGVSTEQITEIIKNDKRRNRSGTLI